MSTEKKIKTAELLSTTSLYISHLFESTEYAWEIIPRIKEYIKELNEGGIEGFSEIAPGVLVGENVKIAKSAVIQPPAVIGDGTELRPGAFL